MKFEIDARCGAARAGRVTLERGSFETPVFMPVGTRASVKATSPADLVEIGAKVILSNAYHLYLRPGHQLIESLGGLHKFMAWDGLILTDSGGYQVFSLKNLVKLTSEGVEFRSHIDGSKHFIRPEDSMAIQRAIGADMVMAFDECPPADAPRDAIETAVDRTTAWVERCRRVELKSHQTLIPIVQGGVDVQLRRKSADALVEMDFPAYAIGGLSVGEERDAMLDAAEATTAMLPDSRPRYLMGVGMPLDIFDAVERGVDMFDCVLPTRLARNGAAFTSLGRINLKNARFKEDSSPVDPDCDCYTCRNFSRAYLRHLFMSREISAASLTTFHNLFFYAKMTQTIRESIRNGTFQEVKKGFESKYSRGG